MTDSKDRTIRIKAATEHQGPDLRTDKCRAGKVVATREDIRWRRTAGGVACAVLVLLHWAQSASGLPDTGTNWARELSAGCALRCNGRLTEAEAHFREAIRIAEERCWWMRLATSLEELGVCQMYNHHLAQAEQTLNKAISCTGVRPNSPSMASKLNSLGMVLMEEGKYDQAEAKLLEAITIYKEAPLRITDPVTSMINLGDCYRRDKKYDASLDVLIEASTLVERGKKIASFEGTNCSTQLVETYSSMNRWAEAEKIALNLVQSESKAQRVAGYCLLTRTAARQKKLEKAVVALEKGWLLYKDCAAKNSALAQSAWELAHDCAAADDITKEARAIRIAQSVNCHSSMDAYWLGNVANQLMVHHHFSDASNLFKQSIALYDELGITDEAVVMFMRNYGLILRQDNKLAAASKLERQATEIEQKLKRAR